jgi:hypothetical protein
MMAVEAKLIIFEEKCGHQYFVYVTKEHLGKICLRILKKRFGKRGYYRYLLFEVKREFIRAFNDYSKWNTEMHRLGSGHPGARAAVKEKVEYFKGQHEKAREEWKLSKMILDLVDGKSGLSHPAMLARAVDCIYARKSYEYEGVSFQSINNVLVDFDSTGWSMLMIESPKSKEKHGG